MDYSNRLDAIDDWQLQHELLAQPYWLAEDESYVAVTETMTFYASSADAAFWQWVTWYETENKLRRQEIVLPC